MVVCKVCKQEKPHRAKGLCDKCYKHIKQSRVCSICGNTGVIVRSNPDICNKCYQKSYSRKIEKCHKCGNLAEVKTRNIEKNIVLCSKCYNKSYKIELKVCSVCGKMKQRCVKNSRVCKFCYNKKYVQPKKRCARCGRKRELTSKKEKLCQSCYVIMRRQTDPIFYIKYLLRKRVRNSIISNKVRNDSFDIKYDEIINHLGPCPGDVGEYHIDHIIPLAAFDFNNINHIKAAFAPENHQWLKAEENMKKNAKYSKTDFELYMKKHMGE